MLRTTIGQVTSSHLIVGVPGNHKKLVCVVTNQRSLNKYLFKLKCIFKLNKK